MYYFNGKLCFDRQVQNTHFSLLDPFEREDHACFSLQELLPEMVQNKA